MREPAKTFQDLVVWERAHEFVLMVYRFSAKIDFHGFMPTQRIEDSGEFTLN